MCLDLGSAKTFTVTDGSKGGMEWVQLKNTGGVATQSPDMAPECSRSSESLTTSSLSPADQALPDQIRGKVGEVDKANGRTFDEPSERMSNSLLAAKDAGMTHVNHVLLSNQTRALPAAHHLFVVHGQPSDAASLRAHLPTSEAAQRPVQESLKQVGSINQCFALEQQTSAPQCTQDQRREPQLSM